jgi:CheY-like chemotaxis protein
MVQPDNLERKMILLVEDDSLSRRAFAQILRAEGYQVAEAVNGVEALEILTTGAEVLTKEAFDLVSPILFSRGCTESIWFTRFAPDGRRCR